MQKIIIENIDSFDLINIFECGQCFRWNIEPDNSYTGVVDKYVLNVKKIDEQVVEVKCSSNKNELTKQELFEFCSKYFDLGRDYRKIKTELSKIDENMKKSIKYGDGIRLLNQDLWETIISFIISANNNIPRIKGIIEKLSNKYGDKIKAEDKEYYTFPTPKQLSKATVRDLRNLGLGFRDIRVYETTQMIVNKQIDLNRLCEEKNTEIVKEELLKLPGVGPKVADCILLFSTLKRMEVFPIDVWVRRVMNELYIKNEDETKVSKKQILDIANKKFGNLSGIAQQYLFYWKRG